MRRAFRAGQGGRLSTTTGTANEDNAALREMDKQMLVVLDFTEH
jgi:hypothetical protein